MARILPTEKKRLFVNLVMIGLFLLMILIVILFFMWISSGNRPLENGNGTPTSTSIATEPSTLSDTPIFTPTGTSQPTTTPTHIPTPTTSIAPTATSTDIPTIELYLGYISSSDWSDCTQMTDIVYKELGAKGYQVQLEEKANSDELYDWIEQDPSNKLTLCWNGDLTALIGRNVNALGDGTEIWKSDSNYYYILTSNSFPNDLKRSNNKCLSSFLGNIDFAEGLNNSTPDEWWGPNCPSK